MKGDKYAAKSSAAFRFPSWFKQILQCVLEIAKAIEAFAEPVCWAVHRMPFLGLEIFPGGVDYLAPI